MRTERAATAGDAHVHRMAPMSTVIRVLTIVVLVVPVGLAIGIAAGVRVLPVPLWDPLESTCRHASLSIL